MSSVARERNAVDRVRACTPVPALLAAALLLPAAPALAFPGRFADVPNGPSLNQATVANRCMLCHTAASPSTCAMATPPTNPCLNPFGMAIQSGGWTPTLAGQDLDGDGFTNGQELQDPSGAWTPAAAAQPGASEYVTWPWDAASHPGLHDDDQDGWCWFGRDMNGDHQCTGAGEKSASDRDCDDGNASRHTGADELCDGADQDCDGVVDEGLTGCDPGAGDCPAGQGENKAGDCLPREQIDGDRDGYCFAGQDLSEPPDWDCADTGEQTAARDCDEFDGAVSPGTAEACLDGKDNDCDGQIDAADADCAAYVDGDQDGFCPAGQDLDGDRKCDTAAEIETGLRDCDDGDSQINPNGTEVCTGGKDEDCDGLQDGRDDSCADYRDGDHDGYCKAGRDRDGDFLCDGRNEQGSAIDCDDTLPNVHAGALENCIDGLDNDCDGESDEAASCNGDADEDGDGYCPLGRDLNGDGDCNDKGEDQAVSDCNDGDDDVSPAAQENCADIIDNDCDGLSDLADDDCERLLDRDGDRYCPAGHDINGDGDCLDFDEERPIADCDDEDPDVRPRIGENCSDGIDNDCNGRADGFDSACRCEKDEQCPVSTPCMVGRCVMDQGCRVVPDPTCGVMDEDAGLEPDAAAGASDGGLSGEQDGGGAGGRNDAGPRDVPELEDVGCGCTTVGAQHVAAAPWLVFGFAVLALRRLWRRRQ